MKTKRKYRQLFFIIPIMILMIISMLNMKSAASLSALYANHFIKQIIWFTLGFILFFLCFFIKPKWLWKASFPLYIISNILLLLVLLFGKEINGAKAWFDFKIFSFQPSELTKLSLMLYLTTVVSKAKTSLSLKEEIWLITKVIIITAIPSVLTFLEPDTGSVLFYLIIAFFILFCSPVRKRWFVLFAFLTAIFIIIFFLLYFRFSSFFIKCFGTSFFYRIDRLIDFHGKVGLQLENALITIGSAPFFGNGIHHIPLYFPEAPTDFIFALTISNFGLFGAILVFFCYLIIDLFLVNELRKTKNIKIKLLLVAFLGIFFFGQLQNIFMNIGLLPIIGIPLPFLSYGGTNLIINFMMIGIILSLIYQKEKYPKRIF